MNVESPAGPTTSSWIDTHFHLWDLHHNRYPWLQDQPAPDIFYGTISALAHDYLWSDYVAEPRPVPLAGAVHVECGWDPTDPVGETRWLTTVAEACPVPMRAIASVDLGRPEALELVDEHASYPIVCGFRQILNWHENPSYRFADRPHIMREQTWVENFGRLAEHDVVFEIQIYPEQLSEMTELALGHPDVDLVLEHAGMPLDRSPSGLASWRDGLVELGACRNVHAKVSGLAMVFPGWTTGEIAPLIRTVVDAFGPDRTVLGSNFPVDRQFVDLGALVVGHVAALEPLGRAAIDQILLDTPRRLYGIDVDGPHLPATDHTIRRTA